MPRQRKRSTSVVAAEAFERHRVSHARVSANKGEPAKFRLSPDEENLARAEVALSVLFGKLHGEWSTIRCARVELERDPALPAPLPRVVLFRVDRLAGLGAAARARFGNCPAWFQRVESKPRGRLFQRHPEPDVAGPEVDEVMGLLGAILKSEGKALMSLTGRTPTMALGFHTAATYEQALASFLEDAYEIVTDPAAATWAGAKWPAAILPQSPR
jgi:hypothetical protein